MNGIAIASDNVCTDPKPRVRFREFGESGLRFQLLAWIEKPEQRGLVIDVDVLNLVIYNESDPPPFDINDRQSASEDHRLKFRYLELRTKELQKNISNRFSQKIKTGKF